MKIKFQEILDADAALAAVSNDGYALRYVLNKELFLSIAAKLNIEVET